jgi:hypothetical protein
MVKTLCNLVDGYQTFEGIYVSIFQNKDDKKMEAESSSKISEFFIYQLMHKRVTLARIK